MKYLNKNRFKIKIMLIKIYRILIIIIKIHLLQQMLWLLIKLLYQMKVNMKRNNKMQRLIRRKRKLKLNSFYKYQKKIVTLKQIKFNNSRYRLVINFRQFKVNRAVCKNQTKIRQLHYNKRI